MKFVKTQQLFFILLTFGLIILPFIYWPTSSIPFELPRVFFIQRFIELLACIGIVALITKKTDKKKPYGIYFTIGFAVIATLSGIFGSDWAKSIQGNFYRGDGLFTLWRLTGITVLIGLLWDTKFSRLITFGVVIGSTLTSLLTIISVVLHTLGISFFPPSDGAFGLTFGQPNFLAGYLTITLPFFWYAYQKFIQSRKLVIVVVILQCLAVFSTKSWGAVLTIGAVAAFILFTHVTLTKKMKLGVLLISIFIFTFATGSVWLKKNELPVSTNAESRQRIFTKLWLASQERPILGWGWANVDHAFDAIDWPYKFKTDVYVDKAHSTLLETFVTTGIVGLIQYVTLLGYCLVKLYRKSLVKKDDRLWFQTIFLALLAFCLQSQTNVVGIAEEFIFWLLIGISI